METLSQFGARGPAEIKWFARGQRMTHEDNDTADRWTQRYHVGRRVIGKRMGTNLSDAIYVELCLRGLREGEITV